MEKRTYVFTVMVAFGKHHRFFMKLTDDERFAIQKLCDSANYMWEDAVAKGVLNTVEEFERLMGPLSDYDIVDPMTANPTDRWDAFGERN